MRVFCIKICGLLSTADLQGLNFLHLHTCINKRNKNKNIFILFHIFDIRYNFPSFKMKDKMDFYQIKYKTLKKYVALMLLDRLNIFKVCNIYFYVR